MASTFVRRGADVKNAVQFEGMQQCLPDLMYHANKRSSHVVLHLRAQKAGLLHSEHPVSISVVHVEHHLYQLDIFFLEKTRHAHF